MAEEGRIDLPPQDRAEEEKPKEDKRTAIAIRYDVDRDKAPLVLASGRGPVADEILRIAEENRIPLYEDRELASLLAKLELDTEIPPELYVLVAEVLFFVYKLDKMAELLKILCAVFPGIKHVLEHCHVKKAVQYVMPVVFIGLCVIIILGYDLPGFCFNNGYGYVRPFKF